jgi:hypothetical protein
MEEKTDVKSNKTVFFCFGGGGGGGRGEGRMVLMYRNER